MAGRPRAPSDQQRAGRILVEAVDQFRPVRRIIRETVEQAVEMVMVFVPPWVASPGGLLSTNASLVADI